jgi:hypothetical protein
MTQEEFAERIGISQNQTLDIAVGGGSATFVFDLAAGRAGYVIAVRLVGRALGALLDCRLTTSCSRVSVTSKSAVSARSGRVSVCRCAQSAHRK